MGRWVRVLAGLMAIGLFGWGVVGARAQSPDQIAAVTINLAVTVVDETGETFTVASATGQVNRTGELSLNLTSPFAEGTADVIVTGGLIYFRANGGPWQYVEASSLTSPAAVPGAESGLPPGCGDQTPNLARLGNPLAALQSIVTITNLGAEQIGVVPVTHYRGDVDLQAGVRAFLTLLALDPDCVSIQAEITEALADIQGEEFPTVGFDVYLGQANSFPYRAALTIDFVDGSVSLLADLAPSTTPFTIRAPADARPLGR